MISTLNLNHRGSQFSVASRKLNYLSFVFPRHSLGFIIKVYTRSLTKFLLTLNDTVRFVEIGTIFKLSF